MDIDELLDQVLSLPDPWKITGAKLLKPQMQVEVFVSHEGKQAACPKCDAEAVKYDLRPRRWRHLNMWDFEAWIVCEVPRVNCPDHGIHKVDVPWADGWSVLVA